MIEIIDFYVELGGFRLRIDRLVVHDNEYLVVLGPSGAGKTVFLHALCGLIKHRGKVIVDRVDVSSLPPEKRGFVLVPQNFALFPHMRVYDNIAFGLKIRRVPPEIIEKKVVEISRKLGIDHLLDRYPHQLSGGEQQRVALARALVVEPKMILLDEPLSNLDPKTRLEALNLLRELHRKLRFTAIHVTHNFIEALTLGNRIAYIDNGEIKVIATPREFIKHQCAKPYLKELEPLINTIKT